MAELAQAYVQIIPSAEGISGNLEKTLAPEAEKAGTEAGKKISASISEQLGSAGSSMQKASKDLSVRVTAPIAAIGTASVAAWHEVDDAMDTIVTKTGASGDALQDMQDRAKAIATQIPASFQQAGDAVGEVNTRFGLTGDALQDLSTKFVQFATINGTDVSTSVDAAQSAMAAFGLSAGDAGNVLDVLNKAGQDTGVNVVQLSSDLSTNAGTLKTFGYNLSDAAMLLANLSKNGVDTSAAMTGLKKVYQESIETGKPMSEILGDLTAKLQNSKTAAEGAQEAADIFGSRAASSLIPALQDGRLSFDALGTSIDSFAGNVTDTYNETLDPLDQMTVDMNKLKDTGADLVNAAAPMISQAFGAMSEVITKVSDAWKGLDEGQQQTIIKIAGVAAAAGPVIGIGGKVVSGIGTITGGLATLGGGIGNLVGKLGSIGNSAGSAVSTISSMGSAASSAAAPVSSAGQSIGTLSQNALGLVAAGAGILLAAAGISMLAKAAIEIANAGAPAAVAMVALTAAVAAMAVGAAALAPALTAGAVGLVAFGAGVTLIGTGILAATAGVALLASQLPNVAKYGGSAAKALTKIGTAMVSTSAGAVTLAAGFTAMLVPVAGAAGTIGLADAALLGLTVTFGTSTVAAAALGVAVLAVSEPVKAITADAKTAGKSLSDMVGSVNVVKTALDGIKSTAKDAVSAISSIFTTSAPTAVSSAQTMMQQVMTGMSTKVTEGTSTIKTTWTTTMTGINATTETTFSQMNITVSEKLLQIRTCFETLDLDVIWLDKMNKLESYTNQTAENIKETFRSSLKDIENMFANTRLEFNQHIKVPHFSFSGSFDAQSGSTPSVSVDWYRKAYDNAYLLNGATIFGAMNGRLLGGGEGKGSELVVGTNKLAEIIRSVAGNGAGGTVINVYPSAGKNEKEIAEEVANIINRKINRKAAVFA